MIDTHRSRRQHLRTAVLLGAALLVPLLIAPSLGNLLAWPIQSVVTRTMLGCLVVFLLLVLGRPSRRLASAALRPHTSASIRRAVFVAMAGTILVCVLYTGILMLGGAESLRPELNRPARVPLALLSGLAVGLLEELIFRRWLLRWSAVGGRLTIGAVVSSTVYALAHYLRPEKTAVRGDYGLVDSVAVYREIFQQVLGPWQDPGPFVGLFLLGLFLCAVATRFGLAYSIGIHAGLVSYAKSDGVFLMWKDAGRDWWFGSSKYLYDGAVFWIVAAVALCVALRLPAPPRRRVDTVGPGRAE